MRYLGRSNSKHSNFRGSGFPLKHRAYTEKTPLSSTETFIRETFDKLKLYLMYLFWLMLIKLGSKFSTVCIFCARLRLKLESWRYLFCLSAKLCCDVYVLRAFVQCYRVLTPLLLLYIKKEVLILTCYKSFYYSFLL